MISFLQLVYGLLNITHVHMSCDMCELTVCVCVCVCVCVLSHPFWNISHDNTDDAKLHYRMVTIVTATW